MKIHLIDDQSTWWLIYLEWSLTRKPLEKRTSAKNSSIEDIICKLAPFKKFKLAIYKIIHKRVHNSYCHFSNNIVISSWYGWRQKSTNFGNHRYWKLSLKKDKNIFK